MRKTRSSMKKWTALILRVICSQRRIIWVIAWIQAVHRYGQAASSRGRVIDSTIWRFSLRKMFRVTRWTASPASSAQASTSLTRRVQALKTRSRLLTIANTTWVARWHPPAKMAQTWVCCQSSAVAWEAVLEQQIKTSPSASEHSRNATLNKIA